MGAFLFYLQGDFIGKPIAPSWGAWAGVLFGGGSFTILMFDRVVGRGKSLQSLDGKIEKLCEQVEDIEATQITMDNHLDTLTNDVRALTQEWRGTDGSNGWRSVLRELEKDVRDIVLRNTRIDAVSTLEKARMKEQGRSPERLRDRVQEAQDEADNS